jgi:hypothetical protein
MVSFMFQLLYPLGKEFLLSIKQAAGWAPEPVWTLWGREDSLVPARNEILTIQLVAHCSAD